MRFFLRSKRSKPNAKQNQSSMFFSMISPLFQTKGALFVQKHIAVLIHEFRPVSGEPRNTFRSTEAPQEDLDSNPFLHNVAIPSAQTQTNTSGIKLQSEQLRDEISSEDTYGSDFDHSKKGPKFRSESVFYFLAPPHRLNESVFFCTHILAKKR